MKESLEPFWRKVKKCHFKTLNTQAFVSNIFPENLLCEFKDLVVFYLYAKIEKTLKAIFE